MAPPRRRYHDIIPVRVAGCHHASTGNTGTTGIPATTWGGAGEKGWGSQQHGRKLSTVMLKRICSTVKTRKLSPRASFREGSLKWQRGEELLGRPFGKGVEMKKGASCKSKRQVRLYKSTSEQWQPARPGCQQKLGSSASVGSRSKETPKPPDSLGQGQSSKFRLFLVLPSNWERAPWLPSSPKLYEPHLDHSPAHSPFWAPSYLQGHQPPLHPGAGGPQPSWHQLPLRFSPQTKTYLDPPAETGGTASEPRGSWP